jgi:hypothetical protein
MMTGPEHYRHAELLLVDAEQQLQGGTQYEDVKHLVALAQVHAALSTTAAIIKGRAADWAGIGYDY